MKNKKKLIPIASIATLCVAVAQVLTVSCKSAEPDIAAYNQFWAKEANIELDGMMVYI